MTDAALRLDLWLWYARIARQRSACVRLIEEGRIRINSQPVSKPHARLRIGDVLTLPAIGSRSIRVLCVTSLGDGRGNAEAARLLYEEIAETSSSKNP